MELPKIRLSPKYSSSALWASREELPEAPLPSKISLRACKGLLSCIADFREEDNGASATLPAAASGSLPSMLNVLKVSGLLDSS